MKLPPIFIILVFMAGAMLYYSCKKEYSCEDCLGVNKLPIANAGNDTNIVLPADSTILDGSKSFDPDDGIESYKWRKISGPDTFKIVHASNVTTIVNGLVEAIYLFELTVTDKGGLSANDTMQVIVNSAGSTDRPPLANAGKDTIIILPTNVVTLDGSGSSDPENNITRYLWTKVAGPSSFSIANANSAHAQITGLVEGIYLFELKVTDVGGLFSKDTVQVIVNPTINTCILSQTLIGSLSIPRSALNILEANGKIVFAGGFAGISGPPMYGASSRVDIYDITNRSWSTNELSLTRFHIGTIKLGNKIYFAGGYNGNECSRVDIYDASNNSWSTAELSEPRSSVVAVSAGNKVLFAGGIASSGGSRRVDIYDQANGTWSIATLSHPTAGSYPGKYEIDQSGAIAVGNKIYIVTSGSTIDVYDVMSNTWSIQSVSPKQLSGSRVVSIGDKIYFSGIVPNVIFPGYPNSLNIYNISSNSWSSTKMLQHRSDMTAIAGDDRIFWAGGIDSSWDINGEQAIRCIQSIEVYDIKTDSHAFHKLQQTECRIRALKTNNKIFFSYGNYTDIYDMNSHSWTTCPILLDQALAIGNTVYQVGSDSRVLQLDF